jgi:hypothetical protein
VLAAARVVPGGPLVAALLVWQAVMAWSNLAHALEGEAGLAMMEASGLLRLAVPAEPAQGFPGDALALLIASLAVGGDGVWYAVIASPGRRSACKARPRPSSAKPSLIPRHSRRAASPVSV